MDGSGEDKAAKTYYRFKDKVKSDGILNDSKLKIFVEKICEPGAVVSYREIDKKKGLK
ncbi:MAG: hypothetical protein IPN10_16730 [Saprospiraceae bacterium]|nr:hypothetical protein [Saprospiraceae bacterium]